MSAMVCHPLTWLTGWVAFVLALQWLADPLWLGSLFAISACLALFFAPDRTRLLLWRTRWLYLSLGLLFVFLTPGEFVRGVPTWMGVTYEGMEQAGDQLARLTIMLTTLAVLHQHLGSRGLLCGLYALLWPFRGREKTVVRLMLVLELAESREKRSWREWLQPEVSGAASDSPQIELPALAVRAHDWALVVLWCLLAGTWIAFM